MLKFLDQMKITKLATDYEGKILIYIEKNKKITTKELKKLFNIKDTRAKEILKELMNKNLIERKGKGRNTHYILK
ncbi:hypothetical protein OSSY52_15760 [Tepiditoga spiralis]|uniref:Transcription regulator TrmB N-terminal domain-containing protein n=1 Tax=Tepiditoga spiralis TaxID=2108365 RepID=A0A7G1G5P0_9BACT|nr:helix-turn-helix domain-containing protein [Tepiditoga spiralis]BBE31435.1 hypothetical protein OSSY52_15760 [Tepiditoga spiralis]